MQTLHYIVRGLWAIASATAYKLAFAPVALAGFVLVPLVIWRGRVYESPITGKPVFGVPSGFLALWSNHQDGLDPEWAINTIYTGWPTFWRRYAWAAWRNKARNLPFVPWLRWLHKPKGQLVWRERRVFGVLVILSWRGWMTELQWVRGRRFGDFGPRLDQPSSWGAVSWAFRPFGRY